MESCLESLNFEPVGVAVFTLGTVVFVEDTFRRVGQSARSEFFDQADDATFVYDAGGELVETNRQAQRLQADLGVECPTIEAFERAFRSIGTDESEVVPVDVDESTRYFSITATRTTIGAEDTGTVVWADEITTRRDRKRELELKEQAMDEATVGITISDPDAEDNALVYVNDGFVEQTGYSREEALGQNCRFLQAGDSDQPALDDLRDAIAAEESTTVELRNYRRDGELFWNRLSVTPIHGENGELVRYIGIQQDVTESKERKRELRAERERFRLLIESTDEYAFLVVGADGDIQTWNEGAANLFGYDTEAALGMPVSRLHAAADRESGLTDRLLQQARIAGEVSDDGWRVRADGSEFYAAVRYAALESDDGAFRGYAMIARDMTQQRRRRRRTERFVEESDDVVAIVDREGAITYASGSSNRVLGYDPDELVGTNLFDYLHQDAREDVMERFFAAADDPEAGFHADCRVAPSEGDWRQMELRCRNMLSDDAIDGMLLYLRESTTPS